MNTFIKLGLLIIFSLTGARIARRFNLPNVTGYLVGGLILGPSLLGVITKVDSPMIDFINDVALAGIAFNIGGEFLLEDFKKVGKESFIITFFEVMGAVVLAFVMMYFVLRQDLVFSLIASAMAAATAPAGTMMVIRQYRAKGPLTNTILPIVALDDALGVMVFGVAISIAKVIIGGGHGSFLMFVQPLIEIVLSLGLGMISGLILANIAGKTKTQEELLALLIFFVLMNTGISKATGLSPILSGMMIGAVFVNIGPKQMHVFSILNDFTTPINLLFFSVAGASLDVSILMKIGFVGIAYVIGRFSGKVLGAGLGAKLAKEPQTVQKYLGLTLLPQGGVAIGLSMSIASILPEYSDSIVTLILFSVLVFEISGPILAKYGIGKAGEIHLES